MYRHTRNLGFVPHAAIAFCRCREDIVLCKARRQDTLLCVAGDHGPILARPAAPIR